MYQSESSFCPRDPQVLTNLRCGRCNSLICPSCLVQSPVGSRCPSCASIGMSPMQRTSGREILLAAVAGIVTAVVSGVALVGLLLMVDRIAYGSLIGQIVGFVAIGYVVGEVVRRIVGYKLDKRIQYGAGLCVFVSYVAATLMLWILPQLNPAAFANIIALAGLGVGIWVAMGRVRP